MTEQITVAEAAKRTGYSEGHIRTLCREGRIEAQRVGQRLYLIDADSIARWADEMEALGSQKHDPTRGER